MSVAVSLKHIESATCNILCADYVTQHITLVSPHEKLNTLLGGNSCKIFTSPCPSLSRDVRNLTDHLTGTTIRCRIIQLINPG